MECKLQFGTWIHLVLNITKKKRLVRSSSGTAAANAARRKQEPVHKDAFAVVIRIVGEQAMPFILLLAAAIARATIRPAFPAKSNVLDGFT